MEIKIVVAKTNIVLPTKAIPHLSLVNYHKEILNTLSNQPLQAVFETRSSTVFSQPTAN